MAENKKGFVLYADLIHTVRKMPKGKQAELFMTILEYVNDQNPEVEDLIVSLVWEPIKHQLKRDLSKYEEFRRKQSENGQKGGRPSIENKSQNNPNNPSLYLETQKSLTVKDKVIVTDKVTVDEWSTTTNFELEKRKALKELFKRVSVWDDQTIEQEVGKFMNKYQNLAPNKSGSLINTWVSNYRVDANVIQMNETKDQEYARKNFKAS